MLADALLRIAAIEHDLNGLGEVFRLFNEQVGAAREFGSGVLKDN